MSDTLKGYKIGGYLIVAEDEVEALEMYVNETGEPPNPWSNIHETNLDDWFMYFDINEINPEDIEHIYDRKYPNYPDKHVVRVSLKRPYARKYCPNGFYDEKSIGLITI